MLTVVWETLPGFTWAGRLPKTQPDFLTVVVERVVGGREVDRLLGIVCAEVEGRRGSQEVQGAHSAQICRAHRNVHSPLGLGRQDHLYGDAIALCDCVGRLLETHGYRSARRRPLLRPLPGTGRLKSRFGGSVPKESLTRSPSSSSVSSWIAEKSQCLFSVAAVE